METKIVDIENPKEYNFIFGQSHFIKTVEDLYEVLTMAGNLKFGIAFCEASGPRLVRTEGNDPEAIELAKKNALAVGAGHSFFVFLTQGFPINCLNAVKTVPEVCRIYCATANPCQIVVAETKLGRGVMSVIDGGSPLGVETEDDKKARKEFLRKIGYKL